MNKLSDINVLANTISQLDILTELVRLKILFLV